MEIIPSNVSVYGIFASVTELFTTTFIILIHYGNARCPCSSRGIHTSFTVTLGQDRRAIGIVILEVVAYLVKTVLQAGSNAGCRIVLADGRLKNVIGRIIAGEEVGTIFLPKRKLSNRARWILNSSPAGTIFIDAGALRAVRNRKSLLPSGVTGVEGTFEAGAVVMLNDNARAVTSIASSQLKSLAGKHSTEIKRLLGPGHRDVVAIPEDIVMIDY